ncbi:transcriptional regulator, AsnC family [Anaerovibrio sp. JC8]|uniref:Lrp/AsnC family transcriptional regulator n=1 Tax=Anaerovibrio sp. JC8 TaxID=1240085 RepID=UPI000A0BCF62|nr:Lrp/AsnC family transcriptional regulator [Anaerovibrio sp. JC8]ORT99418.1 transcriptional regulator, AsnC family [Anaerovibrio sp. JC8]
MDKKATLDKVDEIIYYELSNNARITISELSTKVSRSMPAVSERIKRLEKDGYIAGYTVVPGRKLSDDLPVTMQSMIKMQKRDQWDAFRIYLDSNKYVIWYGSSAGQYDFIIQTVGRDTDHMAEILAQIHSFPGVVNMESCLILEQKRKNSAKC